MSLTIAIVDFVFYVTLLVVLETQRVFSLVFIEGCPLPLSFGDGYCNDENNNEACFFDGGDCCNTGIFLSNCTECKCFEDVTRGGALILTMLYEYARSKIFNEEFNILLAIFKRG